MKKLLSSSVIFFIIAIFLCFSFNSCDNGKTNYSNDQEQLRETESKSETKETNPAPPPEPIVIHDNDISCPDSKHPHVIDLGKAGKWSCCNLGATSPEKSGGFYAWGEVNTKDIYDYYRYKYYIDFDITNAVYRCKDIGEEITGTSYDAAHVKLGGNWCMPSYNRFKRLLKYCENKPFVINKVYGILFYNTETGNSIFFPWAGTKELEFHTGANEYGNYWTSTLYTRDKDGEYDIYRLFCPAAYSFDIKSESPSEFNSLNGSSRAAGYSIRPCTK